MTVVHTRRSIRSYTDQPVSEEDIRVLLEAAMAAPSAGNSRPWEFIVVDDKKLLHGFTSVSPYADMIAHAPLGILVCGNLKAEKFPRFWVQDCSAATQNLLLAVTNLELGAVWLGIYPLEDRIHKTRQLFDLPQTIVPLAMVSIGHHDRELERVNRLEDEKIHRNGW